MNRIALFSSTLCAALATTLIACGSSTKEPVTPVEEAPVAPAPTQETPAAPELSEEEKAKQAAAEKLANDFAQLQLDHAKAVGHYTPEIRAEIEGLSTKKFGSPKAAFAAILASTHRQPGFSARDSERHPLQTLEFFGLKQNQSVLEWGPGNGWYTEILAPFFAAKGKLAVTNGDRSGSKEQRGTYYAERTALMLEQSPALFGKVETVVIDGKAPKLDERKYDAVLLFRNLHGMAQGGSLEATLSAIHGSLKPKGVLGIEQHRAAEGANAAESAKAGYLPEAWVIEQIEAAGFKLSGKSEINANPKDTKDYPEGVWALPPTLARGDKDREALSAIGESDRMTLKFTKVEKKTK